MLKGVKTAFPFLIVMLLFSCGKSKRDLVTMDREVSSLNISGQNLDKNSNPSLIESCKVQFNPDSTYRVEILSDIKQSGRWQLDSDKSRILSFPGKKKDTVIYTIKSLNKKQMVLSTKDANMEMTITLEKPGKKESS